MHLSPLACTLALTACIAAGQGRAAMYKCTDDTGKVAYQDSPCESRSQERRVDARRAENAGSGGPAASADDRKRRDTILAALLAKPFCDQAVPGFRQRTAAPYAAWRQRNATAIARIEGDPDFREQVARSVDVRTAKMKAENGRTGVTCDDGMLDFMAMPAPPAPPAKPPAAR
jgi:hypothetical protein